MGLTKQYLRYIPAGSFNIIASANCNVVFVTLEGQDGRYVAVAACEDVIVWDMRLGEKTIVLPGEKHEVTCLASSPNKINLAVGYSDGSVKIFDLKSGENLTIFSGHRAAITCLAYDERGHHLASGAKDTDVILWDVVAETGLQRLMGHKGVVTQISFLKNYNVLVSSSKDTFVKFWDLDTGHCFKTLVGHRTEVWSLALVKDDTYLVTGCSDSELRVWRIAPKDEDIGNLCDLEKVVPDTEGLVTGEDTSDFDGISPLQCRKAGSVLRSGRGRVVSIASDATGHILGCHGADNCVELFEFSADEEARHRRRKRLRKEHRKSSGWCHGTEDLPLELPLVGSQANKEEAANQEEQLQQQPGLRDEVKRLTAIKTDIGKIKATDLVLGRGRELRVAMTLNNNSVHLYSLQVAEKGAEGRCLRKISSQGHHSEVRAVAFSSDNLAIASGSAECVKMWNRPSLSCLRTVATGYVLTVCFVPGDRHLLVGQKDGKLLIVDIAAGDVLEEVTSHTRELWSLCLLPDQRGCVTGGGDGTVKFWQFELIENTTNKESKAKVLSVLHTRTLKVDECVLAVKVSPDGRLIAVALLDCTVQIFFMDTLKFFLSLYGHKLPVLCLDISYDSTLIATGSGDRNIKIWGLDFGDCHRSIFAHDDSVTGLQFVPRTHQFFTCGKDGGVKQWDADTFNKIITLQAHHGEARSLAVSPNGQYVVSCGSDRVLRLFEKSVEPLVLEDEEEEEREALDDEALATGAETTVTGHADLNLPSKKTVGSEKAADQIVECLEVCREYQALLQQHAEKSKDSKESIAPPAPPALMAAYQISSPEDFVIEILSRIRSCDLEESLLLLPFTSVCELLNQLSDVLSRNYQIELVCRVMVFLFKIHHGPIVSNKALLPVIGKLQKLALEQVAHLRDMVGFNLCGLQFFQREIEDREGVQLFRDATIEKKTKEWQKRKKHNLAKRAIMML